MTRKIAMKNTPKITGIRYGGRRQRTPGNANMQAIEQAAALYAVPYYRQQSRVFTVRGAGGRDRPMFVGGWTDRHGYQHTKGIADFLLTPKVKIYATGALVPLVVAVPLWVEAKAGRDDLSEDQEAFRDDVQACGAYWLCCRDSCDDLIAFFRKHGVTR